ncbi:MAG: glycosyltransferase family 2 protein, partial [Lachnospiraceae bacterium]|nr:glycosyltransferase family 2 protein [Lachnospiraceae bacterium]
MNPKVTVVIPSLNVKDYIGECLDSVTGQTLQEIEIFVVDAYSTDGTRKIIDEYGKKDNRITLLDDREKSTGYSKNLGIDRASAPYYAIVESDDYIEPDMLEKLYVKAEEDGADIVKCGFDTFVGDGEKRFFFPKSVADSVGDYERTIKPSEEIRAFRFTMYEWLGLYRTSFLRERNIRHNESKGAAFQDIGFWFLSMARAEKILLIRDIGYHYR